MNARERRVLAGGAAVAGVVLAFKGLTVVREAWASASRKLDEVHTYASVLRSKNASLRANSARRSDWEEPHLLPGHDAPTAFANASELLTSFADSNSVRLTALVPEADSVSAGSVRRVSARCHVTGDLVSVAGMLRAITGAQFGIVEFVLRAQDPLSPSQTAAHDISVEMLLHAWFMEGEA